MAQGRSRPARMAALLACGLRAWAQGGPPSGAATLLVSETALSFSGAARGENPPEQFFLVTSSDGAVASFTARTAAAWLRVRPAEGVTPSHVAVQVDSSGLSAGAHTARITIAGGSNTAEISVTFTLAASPPQLVVAPELLRFTAVSGSSPPDQLLLAGNTGSGALDLAVSVAERSVWLRLSAATGRIEPGSRAQFRVAVEARTLSAGVYRDVIRVAAAGQTVETPVVLVVSPAGAVLGLGHTGTQFECREGATATASRDIPVVGLGGTTVNWTADVRIGHSWLSLESGRGTAGPQAPGVVTLVANPAGLRPGPNYGLVRVSSSNAVNSPQFITVVAKFSGTDIPTPVPSPPGLLFTAVAGGAAPPAQTVAVSFNSLAPVRFNASPNTAAGGKWLLVAPNSATASATAPGSIGVSVNSTGLRPGVYSGDITLAPSSGSARADTRTVSVTLIVRPAGAAVSKPGERAAAGCAPSRLVAINTGLVGNFSAPTAWPVPLTVRVLDDCADAVGHAQVVATFSSGDPALPLRLADSRAGTYTATWTPAKAAEQVTLALTATAPPLEPVSLRLNGLVPANKAPLLKAMVHNFMQSQAATPLSPGAVAALYGSDLAPSLAAARGGSPLPTLLNGVSVFLGGREAPIYFTSGGQVNVQIPTDVPPDRDYQILLSSGGALTAPETIALAAVQPGVAALPDGTIVAQHSNPRWCRDPLCLVSADAPARAGDIVVIYLGGMGATAPPVAAGELSPGLASGDSLARVTVEPAVTIDGRAAEVLFAGLTPGLPGLYQINLKVPAGLRPGDPELVVTQGTATSNKTRIAVRE